MSQVSSRTAPKCHLSKPCSTYRTEENSLRIINFPTLKNGNNKGFCFVVYDTKESADAAVAGMDKKDLWGLELHVEIANDRNETKPKIKSTLENTGSPAPRDGSPVMTQAAPASTSRCRCASRPCARARSPSRGG